MTNVGINSDSCK